jgi:hypothetical protein
MMQTSKALVLGTAMFGLAACVAETGSSPSGQGMPAVGSSTDVTSFQGARAGQAEGGLRALGFQDVRSAGLTTYWFNRDTGACAAITTADGVYSSVVMVPAQDC